MGKKGVLLDNGKKAQSSMALYWKAGRQRSKNPVEKVAHVQKEVPIEDRAESGHQKWKMHKQKLINKLYSKPEKKEVDTVKEQNERQQKHQQELDRELLEKELNKNKPINIPGFKGTKDLQKKMQFQKVVTGKAESNQLIFPSGQQALSQQQIVQMLRERKAKKQIEQNHRKQHIQRNKVRQEQIDMLILDEDLPQKKKQPEKIPEVEPKIEEKVEEKSIFKSQLLQKIQKGEALHPKKAEQKIVEQPLQPQQFVPKFIPRSLWNK